MESMIDLLQEKVTEVVTNFLNENKTQAYNIRTFRRAVISIDSEDRHRMEIYFTLPKKAKVIPLKQQ